MSFQLLANVNIEKRTGKLFKAEDIGLMTSQQNQQANQQTTSTEEALQRVNLRHMTIKEACLHYTLDLNVFKKELFSTSAVNALDHLNFLKVEDELNLLEWMLGVFERGWFLSDHCLKLYLIFKLNQNHYDIYFGDDRFKNRPSTNWINQFRQRKKLFSQKTDPFEEIRKAKSPLLAWVAKFDFCCFRYAIGPNLVYYIDEVVVVINKTLIMKYKDQQMTLKQGDKIILLNCIGANGETFESQFIFPDKVKFPDEEKGRLSTFCGKGLKACHIVDLVHNKIVLQFSTSVKPNILVVVDTSLVELDYSTHHYGLFYNVIFLNMLSQVQNSFAEEQYFIGRSSSKWKVEIIKNYLDNMNVVDINQLVSFYTASLNSKATNKLIRRNFEISGIFFPLQQDCAEYFSENWYFKSRDMRVAAFKKNQDPIEEFSERSFSSQSAQNESYKAASNLHLLNFPRSTSDHLNPAMETNGSFQVGEQVLCKWTDGCYYDATILKDFKNGAFSVEYTNNKKKTVKEEWLQKQETPIF